MEIYSNKLDIISLLCLLLVATAKSDGLGLAGINSNSTHSTSLDCLNIWHEEIVCTT